MSRARVARPATALVVLALLSGCSGSDAEPKAGPPPPVATGAEPEDAGTAGQRNPATVATRVKLSGGALGGAPTQVAAPTTQDVANALYRRGLKYNNGVQHAPNYVYCEQAAQRASSFACYVEVRGVAPYWISVQASAGKLTFDFSNWAAG